MSDLTDIGNVDDEIDIPSYFFYEKEGDDIEVEGSAAIIPKSQARVVSMSIITHPGATGTGNVVVQNAPISFYLPEEIMMRIFAHLPVRSLLRFKAANKSLETMVSGKELLEMHFSNSFHPSLVIFYTTEESSPPQSHSLSRPIPISPPINHDDRQNVISWRTPTTLNVSRSVRGIFLVHTSNQVLLLNPALRKSNPMIDPIDNPPNSANHVVFWHLGFSPKVKHHILLRLFDSLDTNVCHILHLNDGTWTTIDGFHHRSLTESALIKGSLFYIGEHGSEFFVVKFDIDRGTFTMLPSPPVKYFYQHGAGLFTRDEHLLLMWLMDTQLVVCNFDDETGLWNNNFNQINLRHLDGKYKLHDLTCDNKLILSSQARGRYGKHGYFDGPRTLCFYDLDAMDVEVIPLAEVPNGRPGSSMILRANVQSLYPLPNHPANNVGIPQDQLLVYDVDEAELTDLWERDDAEPEKCNEMMAASLGTARHNQG